MHDRCAANQTVDLLLTANRKTCRWWRHKGSKISSVFVSHKNKTLTEVTCWYHDRISSVSVCVCGGVFNTTGHYFSKSKNKSTVVLVCRCRQVTTHRQSDTCIFVHGYTLMGTEVRNNTVDYISTCCLIHTRTRRRGISISRGFKVDVIVKVRCFLNTNLYKQMNVNLQCQRTSSLNSMRQLCWILQRTCPWKVSPSSMLQYNNIQKHKVGEILFNMYSRATWKWKADTQLHKRIKPSCSAFMIYGNSD